MKTFVFRSLILACAWACCCQPVLGDAFVFPVTFDTNDNRYHITISLTVNNKPATVSVVIDSGNDDGLMFDPEVAQAMGMDLSKGTPGSITTDGGTQNVTKDVPLPASATLGTPLTPTGQTTAGAPALPAKATVNAKLTSDANAGLTSLGTFATVGISTNAADKSFVYFIAKGEENTGMDKVQAIINAAAAPAPPVELNPDGTPVGSKVAVVAPTPPPILPPGAVDLNQGYDLTLGVSASSGAAEDAPFVISSGMPETLITESLAKSLGLSLATLPSDTAISDFGEANVRDADVELHLFPNDPSFPVFNLQVGVMTDPVFNQIGENYLGADVLSQLPFWSIDTTDDVFTASSTLVFAPEPSSFSLAALALLTSLVAFKRVRQLVPRHLPTRYAALVFTGLCLCRAASADAFVFPVVDSPIAGDKRYYVNIQIMVGNKIGTIQALVDTGQSDGLVVNAGVAQSFGLNLSQGTPVDIGTGSGVVKGTKGVPLPSNATLGNPLPPPATQANKTPPPIGNTVTVNPRQVQPANLGLSYLRANFAGFGFATNANNKRYFFVYAKNEAATGLSAVQKILNTAGAPAPPVEVNPDGTPIGSRFAIITPTTQPVLPAGITDLNQGYDLTASITGSSGNTLDAPFVISSGTTQTLITESLAQSLGLNLASLHAGQVDTGLDVINVLDANVAFDLFPDDPSFPLFDLQVGVITDPLFNQIDENYIGADVLSQLPFWEIDVADQRFYASSSLTFAPEPSALAFAAIGLFLAALRCFKLSCARSLNCARPE